MHPSLHQFHFVRFQILFQDLVQSILLDICMGVSNYAAPPCTHLPTWHTCMFCLWLLDMSIPFPIHSITAIPALDASSSQAEYLKFLILRQRIRKDILPGCSFFLLGWLQGFLVLFVCGLVFFWFLVW